MQPRFILTVSAILLFMMGAGALFAADELAKLVSTRPTPSAELVIQLAAAGLLSLAANNWMSRGSRFGGIYGRPLGLANLTLHFIAALSIGRAVTSGDAPAWVIAPAVVFAVLFAAFAWVVFLRDPLAGDTGTARP
jgi:hypothetical protein